MKTLLLVSYNFPPVGGKAVQRASKLAKYLPQFGWRPVVFTMPIDRKEPRDDSLLVDLPPDVEVHRPAFRDWWRLVPHDIRKHLYGPLPDRYRTWADTVRERLVTLIHDSGADALMTTSPTHSTQYLGLAASRETGIPWIADFRDPWSGHPDFRKKRHADHMFRDETEIITEADAVVGVYPKILRDFKDRVPQERLHLIENGYDDEDFGAVDRTRVHAGDALWMGYNGTVSGFHDPAPLLGPLEEEVMAGRLDPATLNVIFSTDPRGSKRFAPYRALTESGVLEIRGYLPHAESIARLAEMDVSLHLLTRGRDIFPGKLFEYFFIGNPVLSLSEPGDDLDRLIHFTGTGEVVDHRDPAAVLTAVRSLIDRKKAGTLPRGLHSGEPVARYSRKRIAERYAALLNDIAGDGSAGGNTS
jgi:glycosyltransferase involved in cell wall biosynthesis